MNLEMLKQMVPLPDLEAQNTFLFVGPHPDDIEIACGGLIAKLVHQRKKVYFLIVTDGGCGSDQPSTNIDDLVKIRKQESAEAAGSLGVLEIYHLDYPDGGNNDVWEISKKIAQIILESNPDVIVCPDPMMPSELHPDHIDAGKAASRALLMASFPLMARRNNVSFDESETAHFRPRIIAFYYTHRVNQVIDLTELEVAMKVQAIQKHASQFLAPMALESIVFYLQMRGENLKKSPNSASSEGYFVMGSIHQHCFPEINLY